MEQKETSSVLIKHRQKISKDLLQALKSAALAHGVSLDVEVASRLSATFSEEKNLGLDTKSEEILRQKLSYKEAVRECQQKKQGWQILYEMDKLERFLRFKARLPRNFKETFELIDVKTVTLIILAELKKEAS